MYLELWEESVQLYSLISSHHILQIIFYKLYFTNYILHKYYNIKYYNIKYYNIKEYL